MIHLIMGLKGSGKTKKLIDAINAAVAEAHGDVVCIEYGKKLTYDVTYKVRLVDSQEYGISSAEMLKGFLSGLHAGNFDITNVFIDNLYKTIGKDVAAAEDFVVWCAKSSLLTTTWRSPSPSPRIPPTCLTRSSSTCNFTVFYITPLRKQRRFCVPGEGK